MKLYSPATVRQIIDKYGFHIQKGLGQNFLIDGNVVNKIVETAEVRPDDVVLEIGAGIGTLTRALAEKAAKVIVIEVDRHLSPILEETLAGCDNVKVVFGNALNINFDELISDQTGGRYGPTGSPYKIVANLPYYITTPLIMHSLENRFNVSLMVFMIQKEVAERMVALPGSKEYGALTLGVNYYCDPQLVIRVPQKVFLPQPEVESMVVRLRRRETPPVPVEDEGIFFRVVRAAFGQRRKTLVNALSGAFQGLEKSMIARMLNDIGIDPARRGETLSLQEFAVVANALSGKPV